jgi:hypothetical protein
VRAVHHALTSLNCDRDLSVNQISTMSIGLFDVLTNLHDL